MLLIAHLTLDNQGKVYGIRLRLELTIVCCPGLTYRQDTSSTMGAIQTRDRHVGGRCVWHFDEAKPAGAPRVPISSNAYPIHLSVNLEEMYYT